MNQFFQKLHRSCGLLLCLCLLVSLLPTAAAANNTVRAAWYEDAAYNITGTNGERSGYGYESQNCHGLRLLRKYILAIPHN